MSEYSTKMPNMSQNVKLAGKTVYDCGMNVHYDFLGYAVWAENPHAKLYEGTTMSIPAQPKADALAGKEFHENWTGYVYWNFGQPDMSHKLTADEEAKARAEYYAALDLRDHERRDYKD